MCRDITPAGPVALAADKPGDAMAANGGFQESYGRVSWACANQKLVSAPPVGPAPKPQPGARAAARSTGEAREESAAIRPLQRKNWVAAHIRERRYELDLTQQEVAKRAGTSHSFISRLESGDHIPTMPVLKRILAVLDEQLPIGIERVTPGEEHEREIAQHPKLSAPDQRHHGTGQ